MASRPTGREDEPWLVNYAWVSELAWICHVLGVTLVFTSTTLVFSNQARGLFGVDAPPDADAGDGREKRLVEHVLPDGREANERTRLTPAQEAGGRGRAHRDRVGGLPAGQGGTVTLRLRLLLSAEAVTLRSCCCGMIARCSIARPSACSWASGRRRSLGCGRQ